jgi:hypothetical protein
MREMTTTVSISFRSSSRHLCVWLVIVAAWLPVSTVCAAPDWSSAENVGGIPVYRDHVRQGRYYYAPAGFRLAYRDGQPEFQYKIFRYIGTRQTGDSNAFELRGILSFSMEQDIDYETLTRVKSQLRQRVGFEWLRPLPIDNFSSALQYAVIETDVAGEIGGGSSAESAESGDEAVWRKRVFMIGLRPRTAELLWDGFHEGRLQLSLSYAWEAKGKVRSSSDGHWETRERVFSDAVPISLDARQFRDHFQQIDSWAGIAFDKTMVSVSCYDFIDEEPTELYRVTVEIKFRTLRDQDYVEKVTFQRGELNFEKDVSFRLAKDLEQPYQYRVTRIFSSGRPTEQTGWLQHSGQHLDITTTT